MEARSGGHDVKNTTGSPPAHLSPTAKRANESHGSHKPAQGTITEEALLSALALALAHGVSGEGVIVAERVDAATCAAAMEWPVARGFKFWYDTTTRRFFIRTVPSPCHASGVARAIAVLNGIADECNKGVPRRMKVKTGGSISNSPNAPDAALHVERPLGQLEELPLVIIEVEYGNRNVAECRRQIEGLFSGHRSVRGVAIVKLFQVYSLCNVYDFKAVAVYFERVGENSPQPVCVAAKDLGTVPCSDFDKDLWQRPELPGGGALPCSVPAAAWHQCHAVANETGLTYASSTRAAVSSSVFVVVNGEKYASEVIAASSKAEARGDDAAADRVTHSLDFGSIVEAMLEDFAADAHSRGSASKLLDEHFADVEADTLTNLKSKMAKEGLHPSEALQEAFEAKAEKGPGLCSFVTKTPFVAHDKQRSNGVRPPEPYNDVVFRNLLVAL